MPTTRRTAIPVLAIALALGVPSVAGADTFAVNDRGDHAPGPCTEADCTLREAVMAAEANAGDDRVKLPSRKPYKLTRDVDPGFLEPENGDLDVTGGAGGTDALTVFHPGDGRATVDAAGAKDRAFRLTAPATLRKLILHGGTAESGGSSGGAVFTDVEATIIKCRLVDNEAKGGFGGGVAASDGSLELRNSKVFGNEASIDGGGIFVNADVAFEVTRSTISSNLAEDGGGGILTRSEVPSSITASTISSNRALETGGGILNDGTDLEIVNSTIARNKAREYGGGIYGAPDTLAQLNAVTVAFNRSDSNDQGNERGGGLYGDGGSDVIEVSNTLVARNRFTDGAPQECDAPAPVGILSEGGNLITTEADGCEFFDDAQDIVDPQPGIGQLGDNGGPTFTVPLEGGSPAINQADGPAAPATDQRGLGRADPDIGAFERQ